MLLYVLWSAKYASADGIAVRTSEAPAVSCALPRNARYDGTAIASRMPMMMMTTRSSMRVKPSSERSRFWRRFMVAVGSFVVWEIRVGLGESVGVTEEGIDGTLERR